MTAIYIIGPRGVGKSTAAEALAKDLGLPFKDQDICFYEEFGHEGKISYQIKEDSKKFFARQFEILKKISDTGRVISVGASNLLVDGDKEIDYKKVEFCKRHGVLVMMLPTMQLEKGAKICYERDRNRPDTGIFGDAYPEEKFDYYLSRYKVWVQYLKIADFFVVNDSSIKEVVEKIKKELKKRDIKNI